MENIFIINPAAGNGKKIDELIEKITALGKLPDKEIQIYITKCEGDAQNFVAEYLMKHKKARFIACGGDGTFSEVLNGALGYEEAEIGVIPIGTGNDFCRNFGKGCDFLNISAQLNGITEKCDCIKYTAAVGGNEKTGCCANMFNIGFDCNVADMTTKIKRKFASGPFAYFLSIFIMLVKKKGATLKIDIDGETRHNGELLLTSIANGCYCGGGIMSNPLACIQDGFINVNIIKNIPRRVFFGLLPEYMKGTHMNIPGIERILENIKCREMEIEPLREKVKVSVDGEIKTFDKIKFEIVHDAFNFVIPSVEKNENKEEIKEMQNV